MLQYATVKNFRLAPCTCGILHNDKFFCTMGLSMPENTWVAGITTSHVCFLCVSACSWYLLFLTLYTMPNLDLPSKVIYKNGLTQGSTHPILQSRCAMGFYRIYRHIYIYIFVVDSSFPFHPTAANMNTCIASGVSGKSGPGWRPGPLLLSWRPLLLGWRPLLLGRKRLLLRLNQCTLIIEHFTITTLQELLLTKKAKHCYSTDIGVWSTKTYKNPLYTKNSK